MKAGWRGLLGVAVSVALMWWALRGESVGEMWDVLRRSSLPMFALSAAVATISFPMRAWRWRYILESGAGPLPFAPLWRATAIGMMVNNVALARAGELARAWVLSREVERVRFAASLASLVVDRVFDTVVVLLLLMVVVSLPGFPAGVAVAGRPIDGILTGVATVALAAVATLVGMSLSHRGLVRVWERTLGTRAPRLMERGRSFLVSFASGLGVLRDPRKSALVFAWAVAQWLVNGASFWIAFRAVGLDAPFTTALFLQSLLAFAVAIPSAPGFFGPFELATKVALGVYAIDDTFAVSYALGYHILSFIPITLIGFWYLWRMGLHLGDFEGSGGRVQGAGNGTPGNGGFGP